MANRLVDGEWRTDVATPSGEDGAFERTETTFRDRIRDEPDARYPPDAGRYHLYIARSCPWAHGPTLVRRLAGLTDVISMDVVDPIRTGDGWQFSPAKDGCTADTVNGYAYLRSAYVAADPDYTGHVSVPVLWDRETGTIVNNESIEIMQMLDDAFGPHDNGLDLRPPDLVSTVDRLVDELYETVNDGVYRAGFAGSQAAYDRAVTVLFDALAELDEVLADQRYLAGERLTLADLRLFCTLVRFDEVYHTHFRCNHRRIVEYDQLWPYLRELYQLPGVAETVNMAHIKPHYYRTHESLNPKQLVPIGPDPAFDAPHDRDRLPGGPPPQLDA